MSPPDRKPNFRPHRAGRLVGDSWATRGRLAGDSGHPAFQSKSIMFNAFDAADRHRSDVARSIAELIERGGWAEYQHEIRDELIDRIRRRSGAAHVRLMPSGSAAIEWALRALSIGPSDNVAVAAMDYPGNTRAVEITGAAVTLIDIADDSPVIDPQSFDHAATRAARSDRPITAVIASHLYGHRVDAEAIAAVCQKHAVRWIDDACQMPPDSIASDQASVPGRLGDVGTYSFGGGKPIAAGSGGAIVTDDERIAAKLRSALDRPSDAYALPPLVCAALTPLWDRFESTNRRRNEVARLWHRRYRILGPPPRPGDVFYKLACRFDSPDHRDDAVARGRKLAMPIGLPFRSLHRTSPRRFARHDELNNARWFAQHVAVLGHQCFGRHDDDNFAIADGVLPRRS